MVAWSIVVFGAVFPAKGTLEGLTKPLGDTRRRIVLVWSGTYAFAVIVGGFTLVEVSASSDLVKAAVVWAPAIPSGYSSTSWRAAGA